MSLTRKMHIFEDHPSAWKTPSGSREDQGTRQSVGLSEEAVFAAQRLTSPTVFLESGPSHAVLTIYYLATDYVS